MASNTFAWRNSENDILWLGQRDVALLRREGKLHEILGFANEKEMLTAQKRIVWTQQEAISSFKRNFDGPDWGGSGGCLAV